MAADFARIAALHRQLADAYAQLAQQDHPEPQRDDRVLTLPEAAHRIGVTRSWLSRRENYAKVGGYLGEDRRVHFGETRLRAYLEAASKRA